MRAFHQPYTNTKACYYAGTFIQHDNLNILRQYLHKPYLLDLSNSDYAAVFWVFCTHVSLTNTSLKKCGRRRALCRWGFLLVQLDTPDIRWWTHTPVYRQVPFYKKLYRKHMKTRTALFPEWLGGEVSNVVSHRFLRQGRGKGAKDRQLNF